MRFYFLKISVSYLVTKIVCKKNKGYNETNASWNLTINCFISTPWLINLRMGT